MSFSGPLHFLLPADGAKAIGARAKALRLSKNLSRQTVSDQSGIPFSTLRCFEQTGRIGLPQLLQLADSLGCMDEFLSLFRPVEARSMDDFVAPARRRGIK